MAAAYTPAGVVVSNSSKKKKKKKGKGRAVDVDQQNAVGAVRRPVDGQVDGEDEGIDDDDDLPALESTGDHHNHHNHHHHHHHTHPDHNHPHISHNHHHHGHRRTGLSPELESVHRNMTAKLNASAQAALRMTSTASAQAELLAAANELYRRMESETRDPTIDGGGRDGADSHSSEYWANQLRSFVQTTSPHGAALSPSERQKSEAMLALAQTMVDEANSRVGFGSGPGGGPPSFDPALLSDPEFQRIVAMSRPSRNMNRFDEYAAEEYYSDNEEMDDLEEVEHEQHLMQQYESTNDGTANGMSALLYCMLLFLSFFLYMNLTPIRSDDDTQFRASCADLAFLLFLRHVPHLPATFLIPLARPLSDIQEEEKEEEKRCLGSATSSATDSTDSTHSTHQYAPPADFHAEPKPATAAAVHAGSTDHNPGASKCSAAPAQLTGSGQAARVQRQPTVVDYHLHQSSADEQHVDRAIHHNAPSKHHQQIHSRTCDQWNRDHPRHLDKGEEQTLE